MRYLILNLLLIITVSAIAQPTVPASNIIFTFVGCNEFTATWTNGNGGDRVVFVRESSDFSDVPVENEAYSENPVFGMGESIKNDNKHFCVYRGPGSSITVKGLKNLTKYYVAVFEYNNPSGGVYNYLTSSYPKKETTTKNIVADFAMSPSAQCLHGNKIYCTNKSFSDLPGLFYNWSFGDATSSTASNPSHSYLTPGVKMVTLTVMTTGCSSSITLNDTLYPHPVVKFELDQAVISNDTIQCWYRNRFTFNNKTTLLDIGHGPASMRYEWFVNTDTPPYSNGYKAAIHFRDAGKSTVKLVAITNHGCRDSTFHTYTILPRSFDQSKISISPKSMYLKNNKFTFTNADTKTWRFTSKSNSSFKDSMRGTSVNYSFTSVGRYYVSFDTTDSKSGCYDKYTDSVEVKKDLGIVSNAGRSDISIYPNPSKSGVFNINNLPGGASLKVYNIIGKELLNLNPQRVNSEINLSLFGAGTYILSLWSEGRRFDYRLVVL